MAQPAHRTNAATKKVRFAGMYYDDSGSNLGVLLFVLVVCLAVFGSLGALIGAWRGHRSAGIVLGLIAGAAVALVIRVFLLSGA